MNYIVKKYAGIFEDQQELMCDLSNAAISNDQEWAII